MRLCTRVIILASLFAHGSPAHAQRSNSELPAPAPTTKEAVGLFDVGLVKRAEAILSSPDKWNRADKGDCRRAGTTYSIRCALRRAVVEGAGLAWDPKAAPQGSTANTHVDCTMDVSEEHRGGSCGRLWDEL
ncbi:MAG TPA: hypothetical protein VF785_13060, partial [Gemmatimonadaceae bacterium]